MCSTTYGNRNNNNAVEKTMMLNAMLILCSIEFSLEPGNVSTLLKTNRTRMLLQVYGPINENSFNSNDVHVGENAVFAGLFIGELLLWQWT